MDITEWLIDNRRRLDNIQGTLDSLDPDDTEEINFGEQRFSLRTDIELEVFDETDKKIHDETIAENLKCTKHARDLLIDIILGDGEEAIDDVAIGEGERDNSRREQDEVDEELDWIEEVEITREGDTITVEAIAITDPNELEETELSEFAILSDEQALLQYVEHAVDSNEILENRD